MKDLITKFLKALFRIENLILLILMIVAYLFLDQILAKYFAELEHHTRSTLKQVSNITSPPIHLIFWPALCIYLYYKKANRTYFFLQVAAVQMITAGAIRVLKVIIGRTRPDLLFSNELYAFSPMSFNHHYHSFPSGHAVTIFALAFSFSYLYPRLKIPLILAATLLASTRILLTYHYLSDVIGGALFALIVVHTVHLYLTDKELTLKRLLP